MCVSFFIFVYIRNKSISFKYESLECAEDGCELSNGYSVNHLGVSTSLLYNVKMLFLKKGNKNREKI